MDTRRHPGAVGAILIASATGCAVNALPATTSETTGQIQVAVPAGPADVTSIHVVVSGDFATPIATGRIAPG